MPADPWVDPPAWRASIRSKNLLPPGPFRRLKAQAGLAGVGDNRDVVVLGQLVDEHGQRVFDQRQLIGVAHRPGDVEEEDQVARAALGRVDLAGLQPDADQAVVSIPRTAGRFHVDGKGLVPLWLRVVIREVVDHFLDSHGAGRRNLVVLQQTPHVRVGGRVDVDRNGALGLDGGRLERVLLRRRVLLGVAPASSRSTWE